MFKKIAVFISSIILLINICGCVALLAGSVAGAGTAVWLSGKLTQAVDASLEQATQAAKDAVTPANFESATKESTSGKIVVQIRSKNIEGEKIWIDIHKITESRSRIEVRVGTLVSDKAAAEKLLKKITGRL